MFDRHALAWLSRPSVRRRPIKLSTTGARPDGAQTANLGAVTAIVLAAAMWSTVDTN